MDKTIEALRNKDHSDLYQKIFELAKDIKDTDALIADNLGENIFLFVEHHCMMMGLIFKEKLLASAIDNSEQLKEHEEYFQEAIKKGDEIIKSINQAIKTIAQGMQEQ